MEASGLWVLLIYLFGLFIAIAIWFAFGFLTQAINEEKGYHGGFWWGFLLGWVGLVVVLCKEKKTNTSIYRPVSAYTTPPADSWKCSCGRYNAPYVTSCVCGVSKSQAVTIARLSEEEARDIALLKEYKSLLDSGVITLEEFDQKKKAILSN